MATTEGGVHHRDGSRPGIPAMAVFGASDRAPPLHSLGRLRTPGLCGREREPAQRALGWAHHGPLRVAEPSGCSDTAPGAGPRGVGGAPRRPDLVSRPPSEASADRGPVPVRAASVAPIARSHALAGRSDAREHGLRARCLAPELFGWR